MASARLPDVKDDAQPPASLGMPKVSSRGSIGVDYYDRGGDSPASNATPEAVLQRLKMRQALTPDSSKLILVLVGLPARGKSFISHKLNAFLNWSGSRTEIFNAGQSRRAQAEAESAGDTSHSRAGFFDSSDSSASDKRDQIAMGTLEELLEWFRDSGGEIGIFDATNSSRERRRAVLERAALASTATGQSVSVVFIESICEDRAVLEANMLAKVYIYIYIYIYIMLCIDRSMV